LGSPAGPEARTRALPSPRSHNTATGLASNGLRVAAEKYTPCPNGHFSERGRGPEPLEFSKDPGPVGFAASVSASGRPPPFSARERLVRFYSPNVRDRVFVKTRVSGVARLSETHLTREGSPVVAPLRNHSTEPSTSRKSPNRVVPYAARGSETGMETMSARPYQRGSTLACSVTTP
jgi:hypothetical protein